MAEAHLNGHGHGAWEKILGALNNPKWDFRTVEGIAKETSLSPEVIQKQLDEHESEVRSFLWKGKQRTVYRSRSRGRTLREIVSHMQTFASQSF